MRTIRKTTKSQRTPTTEIRGLILDASKRIIEEDGYDAFTIRLLSEKADVSPASIYRHIGDKQAVIDALIDDSFQTLREKLLRVTTEDPLQRLYDAGVVYRGHAKASPGIYALLWRWHAGEASEACLAAMTELVRYGQAAGKIRRDDPHLIAWSIWSAVHGFVQFETRPEHDTPVDDDDAAYSFLLRLLIRGVRAPETGLRGNGDHRGYQPIVESPLAAQRHIPSYSGERSIRLQAHGYLTEVSRPVQCGQRLRGGLLRAEGRPTFHRGGHTQ